MKKNIVLMIFAIFLVSQPVFAVKTEDYEYRIQKDRIVSDLQTGIEIPQEEIKEFLNTIKQDGFMKPISVYLEGTEQDWSIKDYYKHVVMEITSCYGDFSEKNLNNIILFIDHVCSLTPEYSEDIIGSALYWITMSL